MTDRAILLKEIDKLPANYYAKVFDFVEYLQKIIRKENENIVEDYKAMAADTEREQEAQEWCNSYFGPVAK